MKSMLKSLMFLALPVVAIASPVSTNEAAQAVATWLGVKSKLGSRLGTSVEHVRTCLTTNGVAFHVVRLSGGGFVVTSSDTEYEPVIAFSESDDLAESEANPLWVLLNRDLSARGARRARRYASANASSTAAQGGATNKWSRLLPEKNADGLLRKVHASTGTDTLSDIRVAPLLQTKWNQMQDAYYSNEGDPCYNYYTPNNYPCGCVATAGAQVMRYHRFPTAGVYDWDSMPLVPADGTTLEQRQAIGKLTSDVGISCLMEYGEDGSSASAYMLAYCLPRSFGYANAVAACEINALSMSLVRTALRSNLDAKLPVIVGLADKNSYGHAAVADGYGYLLSTFYVHINMGYSGRYDAWYAPPDIDDFNIIDTLVYNIYPEGEKNGVICSGRVLTASGTPVAGASVSASGETAATTTTDTHGIYAFILPPGSYTIAHGGVSKTVELEENVATPVTKDGYYRPSPAAEVNNVCDLDLKLAADDKEEQTESTDTTETADTADTTDTAETTDTDSSGQGAFSAPKSRTDNGVIVRDDTVVGVVLLKVGKASRAGVSKVSATVIGLDGKKHTAKAVKVATGVTATATLEVRNMGTMTLTIGATNFVGTLNGAMVKSATGTVATTAGAATFAATDTSSIANMLEDYLPKDEVVSRTAKQWKVVNKAGRLKYVKPNARLGIAGGLQATGDNIAALKLSYAAKTQTFKGSFKIWTFDIEKNRLKSVSAAVTGVVVDGEGFGQAAVKKVKVGDFTVN